MPSPLPGSPHTVASGVIGFPESVILWPGSWHPVAVARAHSEGAAAVLLQFSGRLTVESAVPPPPTAVHIRAMPPWHCPPAIPKAAVRPRQRPSAFHSRPGAIGFPAVPIGCTPTKAGAWNFPHCPCRAYSINQIEYCRNFIFKRHFPIHKIFEHSCENSTRESAASNRVCAV